MVNLVFVDMDDTFVAPDKTIPADNLRILDVAHERGVQFVPCTGKEPARAPAAAHLAPVRALRRLQRRRACL